MLLSPRLKVNGYWSDKLVLSILVISLCITAALRPYDSSDTEIYRRVYENSILYIENFSPRSISDIFFNRTYNSVELGFIFFMYPFRIIGVHFRFFLFVVSLLTSILTLTGLYILFFAIKEDCDINEEQIPKLVFCSWLYFVFLDGILYTSTAIRSGLSMSLGLLFLGLMLTKMKGKAVAIFCLITSILLHSTGLIWILIYLLWLIVPAFTNKKAFIIIWGVLGLGYLANIAKYAVTGVLSFVSFLLRTFKINAFSSYFVGLDFELQKREIFLIVFVGLLCIFAYQEKKSIKKLEFFALLGFAVFTFAYPITAVSRVADYFFNLTIPMMALTNIRTNELYKSYLVNILAISLALPQMIMLYVG